MELITLNPETHINPLDKIKLIFHPTPWRGLNVMLAAMQYIKNPKIELDVYSSCEVYGQAFKAQNDAQYQGLYEQAKALPNVNYIGYKPNEYLKEHLHEYDIFAYPNYFGKKTFCISALESMAAGLYCITTDLWSRCMKLAPSFQLTFRILNIVYQLSSKFCFCH